MRKAKENKVFAKQSLQGKWGQAILITFVYSILLGALGLVPIASLIFFGMFQLGLVSYFVAATRKEETRFEMLFSKTKVLLKTILVYFLQTIYLFLWCLIPFVGFIISMVKKFSYAMTYYIMNDNPEIDANDAITRSREMMNGHKLRLFCLQFSFLGWILLSILTFGILLIYVMPYMKAAEAAFYEDIKVSTVIKSTDNVQVENAEVYEEVKTIEE